MAEVLPVGADGYSSTLTEVETPVDGLIKEIVEEGERLAILARRDYYRVEAAFYSSGIASITYRESQGRASLQVSYARQDAFGGSGTDEKGVQELSAVDVIRDIKCADYFKDLTNDHVAQVQDAWDNRMTLTQAQAKYGSFSDLQKAYMVTCRMVKNRTAKPPTNFDRHSRLRARSLSEKRQATQTLYRICQALTVR